MSERATLQLDNQFLGVRTHRSSQFSLPRRNYRMSITGSSSRRPTSSPAIEVKKHSSSTPLMSDQFFNNILESAGPSKSQRFGKIRSLNLSKMQIGLISLAAVFLLSGATLGFMGWRWDVSSAKQAASLTRLANKATGTAALEAGRNALSTNSVSANTLAAYTVAPNLPRFLLIPKLGIDARVLSVGVTNSGDVATPNNVNDTAWYKYSAQPGQPGVMLIDGHVSSWTAHGVFYNLKKLQPGDQIKVVRGDGTVFTYSVVQSQVYSSGNVNMQAALTPVVNGQPGLNLITCSGEVIPGTNTFNERMVVFATQVSS